MTLPSDSPPVNMSASIPRPMDSKTVPSQPLFARIVPAVGLFFLSPLVAEYLLGNVSFSEIGWGMVILAPMYGGGALLIREVTRQSGHGWGTILLLAGAYGLFQAGILDQSLFNPSFVGVDFQSIAPVPGAGFSAFWAQTFIIGHAIWSIGVPIALVEAFVPRRSTAPWLGTVGLLITLILFLFGSWIIFADHQRTEQFMASPSQLIGTTTIVLASIFLAFLLPKDIRPKSKRAAPTPWLVGGAAFFATSLFMIRPENWWGVLWGFGIIIGMTLLMKQWSHRQAWGAIHRLALAGGALLTYAWIGFVAVPLVGDQGMMKWVGNIVLTLGAIGLLVIAVRTVQKQFHQEVSS